MNKKVIMIANFTRFDHEFQSNCVRITDESVCHGCWNNPKFKFDKGNWNYCPEHEDTPRQFECHNNIKPERIISEINKLTM
jgi:autotransporter strand-loop-strand O-heptosyltransferase